METVNVRISPRTSRGKHLIALLRELAKDWNEIIFDEIPNSETNQAIDDARIGKGFRLNDAPGTHFGCPLSPEYAPE
jgi:hypothetical protein